MKFKKIISLVLIGHFLTISSAHPVYADRARILEQITSQYNDLIDQLQTARAARTSRTNARLEPGDYESCKRYFSTVLETKTETELTAPNGPGEVVQALQLLSKQFKPYHEGPWSRERLQNGARYCTRFCIAWFTILLLLGVGLGYGIGVGLPCTVPDLSYSCPNAAESTPIACLWNQFQNYSQPNITRTPLSPGTSGYQETATCSEGAQLVRSSFCVFTGNQSVIPAFVEDLNKQPCESNPQLVSEIIWPLIMSPLLVAVIYRGWIKWQIHKKDKKFNRAFATLRNRSEMPLLREILNELVYPALDPTGLVPVR